MPNKVWKAFIFFKKKFHFKSHFFKITHLNISHKFEVYTPWKGQPNLKNFVDIHASLK